VLTHSVIGKSVESGRGKSKGGAIAEDKNDVSELAVRKRGKLCKEGDITVEKRQGKLKGMTRRKRGSQIIRLLGSSLEKGVLARSQGGEGSGRRVVT